MVSLAASADGCLVASSALDSHVRVWNARTHETRVVIATPPGENWHLGFIPDSTQGGGGSSLLAVAAGAAPHTKRDPSLLTASAMAKHPVPSDPDENPDEVPASGNFSVIFSAPQESPFYVLPEKCQSRVGRVLDDI